MAALALNRGRSTQGEEGAPRGPRPPRGPCPPRGPTRAHLACPTAALAGWQ